ncbi:MAG: RagB/SusD family nutrient uptake outer membrane protein [Cloacibacterium sp.]
MKKLINSVVLASTILFVSCGNDVLEPYTPGSLTEEVALTTSDDVNRLLNFSYNQLTNRTEAVFASVFTDEVGIGYANGGQGLNSEWVFFMNTAQPAPVTLWNMNYFALARLNRVIKYADEIKPLNANDAVRLKNMKAEALVLRAYCHLRILSYFSPNPKDNNALAGILANKIFLPQEKQNPRAKNAEFYALIHQDLDAAIATFTANNTVFNPVYANINFARGLKARAYMFKGDYTNAEKWADEVITKSGLTLANPAQYRQMFFSDNQPANVEVIFKFKRTNNQNSQGSNLHNGWCSVAPTYAGSPFYEIGRSLHNLFNPTNITAANISTQIRDVRASVLIAPTSLIDPNYATSSDYRKTDVLVINKHGGTVSGASTAASTATNAFNNDLKVMRLSEMYLIKAEARAEASDFPGVVTALKFITDARGAAAPTLPTSKAEAFAQILTERRKELAFEGFRYLDLKRLGAIAGVSVDRDPADYSSSSANFPGANPSNLPINSYKWTLPIPQDELNVNPNIQQNPGY